MTAAPPFDRRTFLVSAVASAALASTVRAAEAQVPPADREWRVPVQGGRIHVRVNGDLNARRAPLLMVHGGPGGALWQFFPALPLATDRAVTFTTSWTAAAPMRPATAPIGRWTASRPKSTRSGKR